MMHQQEGKERQKHLYACLIIGDELLDGHVQESNLGILIKHLYAIGYKLQEVRIVSDELHALSEALTELRKKYCMVISIGGLGATHDDRTMAAYAKSFERELSQHSDMLAFFYRIPRDTEAMRDSAERMSTMPAGTELIQLDEHWPIIKLENCFALPGLPSICKRTIEKLVRVLPKQEQNFYRECYVGIREHEYAAWLRELAISMPELDIGSYPITEKEGIRSKISVTGRMEKKVEQCFSKIMEYMGSRHYLIEGEESQEHH